MTELLTKDEAKRLVMEFIPSVRSVYPDAEVYLFGSYAKGTARENSDIDVGVVIPELDENPELNWGRKGLLENMAFDIDWRLSPTVVTPNNKSGFFDCVTQVGERLA